MVELSIECPETHQPCEFAAYCLGTRGYIGQQPEQIAQNAVDEALLSSSCSEQQIAAVEEIAGNPGSPIAFLAHLSVGHLKDTRSFFRNRTVA